MGWLLRRLLLALVAMATGGLAGFGLLGRSGATIGLIAGGLIGAAGLALYERRRGEQLLTWLRQRAKAPRREMPASGASSAIASSARCDSRNSRSETSGPG